MKTLTYTNGKELKIGDKVVLRRNDGSEFSDDVQFIDTVVSIEKTAPNAWHRDGLIWYTVERIAA